MKIKHIALPCSSEERADKFYRDLLGLKKHSPKVLPPLLCRAIFDVEESLTLIYYTGEGSHFEIFITPPEYCRPSKIGHICIAVGDRDGFIKRCEDFGVQINKIPKDDKILFFISDYDNNLFEIKA